MLTRAARPRTQDYCGVLSEDSLRKNFILVYELLDEMVDYGCDSASVGVRALQAQR